ncbi:GNAT family N-acetyltransferase [Roseomonas hellenica]|uniref:GNAT family N-acetyltransferase n=1 Tax=Plastoroseomonas hellenica TaxID=2687306 RepID=A0ABS5F724_9PROT|nr:GNAT family N-acetyltransferase [Plastoroseomonas hellenica]MBR0668375.1 GNAT family N-acetyltransferase [Plastoroseomonas hellenica]
MSTAGELLKVRPLAMADLAAAQALSAAHRWPHRVEDWQFALALGEGIAAEAERQLVGTAMAWRFGSDWSSLGMVMVAPERQGKGIGRRLMHALLAALGDRSILLHATPEGEPLYRTLGFAPVSAVRQHQGAAFCVGFHPPRAGERIRPAGRADLAVLTALDSAATGMARGSVLAALLEQAACVVLDRAGVASGFAMLRRFGRGQLIGPVVAPDAEAARLLIAHWLGQRQGEFLRIDMPADTGLSDWLAGVGLPQVDVVTRMVRGAPRPPAAVRSFALVSQALG